MLFSRSSGFSTRYLKRTVAGSGMLSTICQTFPDISYRPHAFGGYVFTGLSQLRHSAYVRSPFGSKLAREVSGAASPHGYFAEAFPARAAYSNSATVGSR